MPWSETPPSRHPPTGRSDQLATNATASDRIVSPQRSGRLRHADLRVRAPEELKRCHRDHRFRRPRRSEEPGTKGIQVSGSVGNRLDSLPGLSSYNINARSGQQGWRRFGAGFGCLPQVAVQPMFPHQVISRYIRQWPPPSGKSRSRLRSGRDRHALQSPTPEPRCRARLSGTEIGFIGSCYCEIAQAFDQRVCPGGARPEATTRHIAELGSRPCRSNRQITPRTPPPCDVLHHADEHRRETTSARLPLRHRWIAEQISETAKRLEEIELQSASGWKPRCCPATWR